MCQLTRILNPMAQQSRCQWYNIYTALITAIRPPYNQTILNGLGGNWQGAK